jgi:penicillin amidase
VRRRRLLGVLGGAAALAGAGLLATLRRSLPQTRGTVRLAGLNGQVEVICDRWGVPHIYANSADDLFFAQGYVHAQDRLWQMEFQRRLAAGRLSEVLGEATLEIDRTFRILGLYRAAEADIRAFAPESRQLMDAYVAGVNAYLARAEGRLPIEFRLLRYAPEPWRLADSFSWLKVMAWMMSGNWASEVIRARLAAKLGADLAADLEPPYPADAPTIVHGSGLPEGATPAPNGWGSDLLRDALRQVGDLFRPVSTVAPAAPPGGLAQAAASSNEWVVSGERSESGWPLLANDAHMLVQMPAVWYQAHLVGGGYNMSGVSLPGLPGVAAGHNEYCAWGITVAWQDCQDLYVERLNPQDSHQYEYMGNWLDAAVIREEIRVKGRTESVVEEVLTTRHGPIISSMIGEDTPLALRWVGLDAADPVQPVARLNRAHNWEEFRTALSDWAAPSLNFVYADRLGERGNIGYVQAGKVPVRARGYGLVPVPGWTEEYEWRGYLSLDDLPQAYNPADGWLATSNNLVVDSDYAHFLSADLENPCRVRRAVDLITSRDRLSADDCVRFQLDTYSAQAERFVRHVLDLEAENETERRALTYLKAWDAHLEPDSVAASLYEVCRLRALHLVFAGHLGELADFYIGAGNLTPLGESSLFHDRSIVRLLDLLDGNGNDYWLREPGSGQIRSRQDILRQALKQALASLTEELGADMERWTWGRLNRVLFAHTFGAVRPLGLLFNRGPYPQGGDQETLLRAAGKPQFPLEPAQVVDGLRFVADLSDWERCRITIPGGQSGHPASRHYADLIPLWRQGRLQAMPFAREQVERFAESRLLLIPGAAT